MSFLEALGAVCHYGRLAGVEFATLATNASLAQHLVPVLASIRARAGDDFIPPDDLELDFAISKNRMPD